MLGKKKECRICYNLDLKNNLISPCKCIGTIKYTHKKCIENFIELTDNDKFKKYCSVCNTKYDFIKQKFTFIQYVCLFLAMLGFLFYFTLVCYIVAQFTVILFK